MSNDRPTLGPFMSLTCFQYLRVGTEDVADRAPIVASGRKRGSDLAKALGLAGSTHDASIIHEKLAVVLGADGTRLCIVQHIEAKANGGYEVHITEGACTAGQKSTEPLCAFTMGVFIGAIEGITGDHMRGYETECSACGAKECVYQIEPV